MTTFKPGLLAAALCLAAGAVGAQTLPKELTWAVGTFAGDGEWTNRLPQLLVRSWDRLATHRLTDTEVSAIEKKFLDDTLRGYDQQESQALLALDLKKLAGTLPSTEPAATEKTLADLATKRRNAGSGTLVNGQPPASLPLKPLWAPNRTGQSWTSVDRRELASQSQGLYLVTGSVRVLGPSLAVEIQLSSTIENRVLVSWEDHFAPDEAAAKMGEASAALRQTLLGRPWAGLDVRPAVPGSRIRVSGTWHDLPWTADDLDPGTLDIELLVPGRPASTQTVTLETNQRTVFTPAAVDETPDRLVLETDPPGASLFLDSQYLGPSPQTVDRPLATTRVRAQAPGMAALTWEVGPATASPSRGTLVAPRALPDVEAAKDKFYWTLAAFSFSLTSSAFVGAWFDEQVKLTNAYVPYTASSQTAWDNYQKAADRTQAVRVAYAGSIVLTSGVFVWMMFALGDYLGAAQASLP
jgi:hypothetical protein